MIVLNSGSGGIEFLAPSLWAKSDVFFAAEQLKKELDESNIHSCHQLFCNDVE